MYENIKLHMHRVFKAILFHFALNFVSKTIIRPQVKLVDLLRQLLKYRSNNVQKRRKTFQGSDPQHPQAPTYACDHQKRSKIISPDNTYPLNDVAHATNAY
jgi:hypothetical protein